LVAGALLDDVGQIVSAGLRDHRELLVPICVTDETLAFGGNVVGCAAAGALNLTGAAILAADTASRIDDLKSPANCRAPPICETKASPAEAGVLAAVRRVARRTTVARILSLTWHDADSYRVSLTTVMPPFLASLVLTRNMTESVCGSLCRIGRSGSAQQNCSFDLKRPATVWLHEQFYEVRRRAGLAPALLWRYLHLTIVRLLFLTIRAQRLPLATQWIEGRFCHAQFCNVRDCHAEDQHLRHCQVQGPHRPRCMCRGFSWRGAASCPGHGEPCRAKRRVHSTGATGASQGDEAGTKGCAQSGHAKPGPDGRCAPGATVGALPNQASAISETYGDWTLNCGTDKGAKFCTLSQAHGQ
jgi:hypothetical protein